MLIWALRKRFEINTMKISFVDEDDLHVERDKYELEALERQRAVMKDSQQLEYVSEMLQELTMEVINRLKKYLTVAVFVCAIFIWIFFEEQSEDSAQAIYFFIGAFSQLFICGFIFRNYKVYDPRVIFLSR
jgi:hypothetical protein